MKRFLLPLAAVAIAGLLLPAGLRPAYACSCALLSTEEYVNNADVIAIGTVVQLIETAEQFPPVEEESDGIIPDIDAVVAVERYLKGDGPAEIEVDDPPSDGTCGFLDQASLGERHLLFLTNSFTTHICAGSTLLTDDPANLQFLQDVQAITGPGSLPPTGFAPPADKSGDSAPWLVIALGTAALAGAFAFLLRRSMPRR